MKRRQMERRMKSCWMDLNGIVASHYRWIERHKAIVSSSYWETGTRQLKVIAKPQDRTAPRHSRMRSLGPSCIIWSVVVRSNETLGAGTSVSYVKLPQRCCYIQDRRTFCATCRLHELASRLTMGNLLHRWTSRVRKESK